MTFYILIGIITWIFLFVYTIIIAKNYNETPRPIVYGLISSISVITVMFALIIAGILWLPSFVLIILSNCINKIIKNKKRFCLKDFILEFLLSI